MTGRERERMMVSCQPLGGLLEEVERRGGDLHDLVGHLGRPLTDLRGRRNRIPWDDFRSVLERVGEHYDDDEIVDVGRCLVDTTAQRPFLLIAKRFLSVGDFYRAVFSPESGWGKPMFPCMDSTFAQMDDGFFELGVTMHEGVAGSLPFMLITKGNIIGMAEVMGGAPPEIRAEVTERSARFDVRVDPTVPRLARARRRLTLPLRANEMAAELHDAHTSLRARYDALTEALAEREKTTEDLRRSQTNLRLALESVEMTLWDLDLRNNVLTVDGIGHQLVASDSDGASPGLEFFLPLVIEEDRDAVADAVRASIRTSTPWEQQFRVERDGEVRILEARAHVLSDESGEPSRFVGVTNDVTEELRRTERDLHLGQAVAGFAAGDLRRRPRDAPNCRGECRRLRTPRLHRRRDPGDVGRPDHRHRRSPHLGRRGVGETGPYRSSVGHSPTPAEGRIELPHRGPGAAVDLRRQTGPDRHWPRRDRADRGRARSPRPRGAVVAGAEARCSRNTGQRHRP